MNFRQAARRLIRESQDDPQPHPPSPPSNTERPWQLERHGTQWVVSNPNGEQVFAGSPHGVVEYMRSAAGPKESVVVAKLRRMLHGLPVSDLEPAHMEG